MPSGMQAALGVAVDEALQLGMDWIWARVQELASLLRSLLAGASRHDRVLVCWLRCRRCVAMSCIDQHPLVCPPQLSRCSAAVAGRTWRTCSFVIPLALSDGSDLPAE